MINKTLESISNKYSNKFIIDLCKQLQKKIKFKTAKDFKLLSLLGTYMYVYSDFKNAISVFEMTDNIKFKGNWDIWHYVFTCQILKARVYSKIGQEDLSEEIKKNLIAKTTGRHLNWKSDIDKYCTVPADDNYSMYLEHALDEGDIKYALMLKMFKLIDALKYIEGSVFKDKIYESKLRTEEDLIEEIKNMENIL